MRIPFRILVGAMTLTVLGTACSSKKELNSSSAKSFLKEAIGRDHKEEMLLRADGITKTLTSDWTYTDYRSMTTGGDDVPSLFRRMLDAGYVEQKSQILFFPDLAGDYRGEAYPIPGIYAGPPKPEHSIYELGISTVPASLSLSVRYNYHLWSPSGQEMTNAVGTAAGTLSGDTVKINYPYGTLPAGDFKFTINGSLVKLVGPSPTGEMTLSGNWKGGKISMTTYSYSPSAKLLNSERDKCSSNDEKDSRNCLILGSRVLDDVQQLLLDTSESASGKFTWHSELTKVGAAVVPPGAVKNGTGNMQFRKQPDGDWVLVSWSYR